MSKDTHPVSFWTVYMSYQCISKNEVLQLNDQKQNFLNMARLVILSTKSYVCSSLQRNQSTGHRKTHFPFISRTMALVRLEGVSLKMKETT